MTKSADQKINRFVILILCLVFVVALFIRIKYIENTSFVDPVRADARQYVIYGYNLAFHGTFSKEFPSAQPMPDSFRSPGYPLLIAWAIILGQKLGEMQLYYFIILYAQAVLSALLIPLTFMIGIRFLSAWASVIATVLVAFSPHLISMTSYLLTETLFSILLLSAIFCFYHAMNRKSVFSFVAAGFFFGFAYMTNETVLFIPVLFSLSLLFKIKDKPGRQLFMKICIFMIVFSLFPIGWALRNRTLPSNAPKGNDRALATMSHGAYPAYIYKDPAFKYYPYYDDPMQPEFSSSLSSFVRILWSRFQERPIRYITWYLLEKPYYFWSWNILQGQGDVYVYEIKKSLYQTSVSANFTRKIMKFLHPVLLILALLGIPLIWKEYRFGKSDMKGLCDNPLFLFIILIYYTLLYMIFFSEPRYSIPFRPGLYLWSILCFNVISQKVKDISGLFKTEKVPISEFK